MKWLLLSIVLPLVGCGSGRNSHSASSKQMEMGSAGPKVFLYDAINGQNVRSEVTLDYLNNDSRPIGKYVAVYNSRIPRNARV